MERPDVELIARIKFKENRYRRLFRTAREPTRFYYLDENGDRLFIPDSWIPEDVKKFINVK